MARVYLGICTLKRPFDDQRQERIRREAEAVAALLESIESGVHEAIRSPSLVVENSRNPREDRRLAAALWLDGASVDVPYCQETETRARDLVALGFPLMDAFHVAFAEAAQALYLVTCDDDLVRLGERHREMIRVAVASPIEFLRGGFP